MGGQPLPAPGWYPNPSGAPGNVRAEGLEPSRSFEHGHLKTACMPDSTTPAAWPIVPRRSPRNSVGGAAYLGTSPARGAYAWSAEQFEAAKRLIAAGVNDCEIERQIGVPRTTMRDWRRRPPIQPRLVSTSPCGVVHNFSAIPAGAYCYVLGLYLGDGCISRSQRVWRIRIVLDTKYPAIIDRCREAIDMLMPGPLPQHGPGKKHLRLIRLEPWQRALVDEGTEEFILGL